MPVRNGLYRRGRARLLLATATANSPLHSRVPLRGVATVDAAGTCVR